MSNKDGVCMKAEWQNYSIFKPKHTTFLTLREISSKLFPVCWQFMKRNGFFSFRYSFKKESTSFLCILATFLSRKFGRLFLLDKRLKTSSNFLKLLMQKFFFCGCMRAKPVKRALTSYMFTCAFNSFATPYTVRGMGTSFRRNDHSVALSTIDQ